MDSQQLKEIRQAGKLAGEALIFGRELVKPGAKLLDVTEQIEKFIFERDGKLAFPVNISMNDTAAHNAARPDEDFVFNDEVVKLDIGVHVNGYVGDNACTIDLSGKNAKLVEASREALNNALKIVKPGVEVREIGRVVAETIESYGFKPIANLSGHGVAQFITHTSPTIPNYDNEDDTELEEGMTIAIEPFATDGSGMIRSVGAPEIFSMHKYKPMRVGFAKDIVAFIKKEFLMLPFSRRSLLSNFSEAQVNYTLKTLKQMGILEDYAPLVEKAHGLVSQAEHTVLVTKDGCEVLTKVD